PLGARVLKRRQKIVFRALEQRRGALFRVRRRGRTSLILDGFSCRVVPSFDFQRHRLSIQRGVRQWCSAVLHFHICSETLNLVSVAYSHYLNQAFDVFLLLGRFGFFCTRRQHLFSTFFMLLPELRCVLNRLLGLA